MEIFAEGKDFNLAEHQEELESLLRCLSHSREQSRWGDLLLQMSPPESFSKLRCLIDEALELQRAIDANAVRALLGKGGQLLQAVEEAFAVGLAGGW